MDQLSLLELNTIIKQALDLNLEPSYWVVAEIGEMRLNQKGHCYMELVEKEGETVKAKIRANIWAYNYRNLSGWFEAITHQSLQPGIKILANVQVNFHELYGLSLNIKDIDPNFTLGERARKKQEVIAQLVEDGVFDMNKEQELPLVPQNIAVISSPTAAGYGDFNDQLTNNSGGYHFNINLFQALMQGDEAKESIIEAMHQVYEQVEDFDTLVIIRGGGSQVDLDCFDTYDLAAHVAQFPLPVITGIGHERDETIVDLVAHTKMKTPTAVAEFLLDGIKTFDDKLDQSFATLAYHTERFLQHQQHHLEQLRNQLLFISKQKIQRQQSRLDLVAQNLQHSAIMSLNAETSKLNNLENVLSKLPKQVIDNTWNKLKLLEKTIELGDPNTILQKGFSITRFNGKALKNETVSIQLGDIISTETSEQTISSKIQKIKSK
ncbi:exodeoxyribonuclease VII large subunit [Fulvivirgaceae bacterium BMA10]|uniref:Exodeoxyribonuclease 7 large subunit n=1 Tax=Splendidivirga corallicola TaxID=3051826 RepID=A0ABT8KXX8_9BACT|nr:exodeoxyribonuclease VII large subunit [Fulvivirgaceae bacterium BMA10]